MAPTYAVPVVYVGCVDEIDTRRLDGTELTVAQGETFFVTADDAPLFGLQPDNFDVPAEYRPADVDVDEPALVEHTPDPDELLAAEIFGAGIPAGIPAHDDEEVED